MAPHQVDLCQDRAECLVNADFGIQREVQRNLCGEEPFEADKLSSQLGLAEAERERGLLPEPRKIRRQSCRQQICFTANAAELTGELGKLGLRPAHRLLELRQSG